MRMIDADSIGYCNYDLDNYHSFRAVTDEEIAEMPTIDPESLRPRGRWIDIGKNYYTTVSQCSECGAKYDFRSPYCPNCGAKMEEETE